MRLKKVLVQKYRSIKDSTEFDIEKDKTILVGPNEAGKTAILKALQQINPPKGIPGFDPLRDYPRSEYNDITTGRVVPSKTLVVQVKFELEAEEKALFPDEFKDCCYVFMRYLNNATYHRLEGGPERLNFKKIKKDLMRLAAEADVNIPKPKEEGSELKKFSEKLGQITQSCNDNTLIQDQILRELKIFLNETQPFIDEQNAEIFNLYEKVEHLLKLEESRQFILETLNARLPVFVYFHNYFRVRPLIHLSHLAYRLETKILDDEQFDYGNSCLLKLLGFTAKYLSDLGNIEEPKREDAAGLKKYRDQLDERDYQLNAASVKLTKEIRSVWLPDPDRADADRLRVKADRQYLKVVVEDDLGVEIELDQRSEGFQWLVSFFVVFFAEAMDKHENAILLLDEPGLSLHGLKQRDFRETISRLAKKNQTLYTTHSPFLVGPNELDLVRVVEMAKREIGTKVHTTVVADDPASLLPLQEALGYDLAQSLFSQTRNLILEGLTDSWYLEGTAQLLREAGIINLNQKIALIPAANAGKVVYFATILHAHNLKVAALLDSDAAGDRAAQQEVLVNKLGNKKIIRTKDALDGEVQKPEIEDLLRETLIKIAKVNLNWDVESIANAQPTRPIIDIFQDTIGEFSKYKLAKTYLRWIGNQEGNDLTQGEIAQWAKLIDKINKALQ